MTYVNFHSSIRKNDVFIARKPKLCKYLYLRYLGTDQASFGYRNFSLYHFEGSNDKKIWIGPFNKDARTLIKAYKHFNVLNYEIDIGWVLERKNPSSGKINKVKITGFNNGAWKALVLEEDSEKSKNKHIKKFINVTDGYFRDWVIPINVRSRLAEVENE